MYIFAVAVMSISLLYETVLKTCWLILNNYLSKCQLVHGHSHEADKNTQSINSYSASHDNWCTVGGDGGCRVGKVWAGTTSPMPDHKGFKLQ